MNNKLKNRIEAIDGLRGFAIVAILLLHNLEHFDLYFLPEYSPEWLKILDTKVWDWLFFLFVGKAYSIFAILCSYWIYFNSIWQPENQIYYTHYFSLITSTGTMGQTYPGME